MRLKRYFTGSLSLRAKQHFSLSGQTAVPKGWVLGLAKSMHTVQNLNLIRINFGNEEGKGGLMKNFHKSKIKKNDFLAIVQNK